ncbi:hypothetical protein ACQ4PT_008824 [Festuca glaucescens]
MEMPGGSGGAALARQGSIYSLTFDEFQTALGGAGKDFGSMNMDELLRNIWTAEESNAIAAAAAPPASNVDAQPQPQPQQQAILRQGSMTLPRTISQMTVDEVWRDLMGFCDEEPDGPLPPQPHPQAQRQPTLGAMTLEEFLVRAGVVREDMGDQTVVVPARPQPLFPPQGNVVATTMQMGNGVVGQGAGGGMTVAAPTTPVVLNGFGKMEGDDLSSLSPVPYPFDTAMRARKGPTVEKVVERRQRRMIKNRESAARSRQRKQAYIMELEAEVAKLKENNEELQKKQVEMLQKQKNEVIERIEQQLGPKAKRFCLRRTLTGPWLKDVELLEFFGPCSPIHHVCDSSPIVFDAFRLPPECCSGPSPLLSDEVEDNVASPEGLRDPSFDDVEGFGLAELFVEAPVSLSVEHSRLEASVFEHDVVVNVLAAPLGPIVNDPEVADSTLLCDFLANMASKKLAPMSPLHDPLVEIPVVSVIVPASMAAEGIQVDPGNPAADKLNAFLSSFFRPVPPPILATPPTRRARAPKEVATTPLRSGRIEKQKQMWQDATTQELPARALGVLEENAEFDDNALAAFVDKFKTPLSPRSTTMLGSLVKNMKKVKKAKGNKIDVKKKAFEII